MFRLSSDSASPRRTGLSHPAVAAGPEAELITAATVASTSLPIIRTSICLRRVGGESAR